MTGKRQVPCAKRVCRECLARAMKTTRLRKGGADSEPQSEETWSLGGGLASLRSWACVRVVCCVGGVPASRASRGPSRSGLEHSGGRRGRRPEGGSEQGTGSDAATLLQPQILPLFGCGLVSKAKAKVWIKRLEASIPPRIGSHIAKRPCWPISGKSKLQTISGQDRSARSVANSLGAGTRPGTKSRRQLRSASRALCVSDVLCLHLYTVCTDAPTASAADIRPPSVLVPLQPFPL